MDVASTLPFRTGIRSCSDDGIIPLVKPGTKQRGFRVNRTDLHQLADARIAEAKTLLDASHWPGAYYLAGYAVESALKACIAKLTKAEDFPDKDFVAASWTHKLLNLVEKAGLTAIRETECKANPALSANWQTAKDWKESSRYEFKSEKDAKDIFAAITDPTNGVLPRIKLRW